MNEEQGDAPIPPNSDEATSTNDGVSSAASAQTEVIKNTLRRNESDATDAAKTVDYDWSVSPDADSEGYIQKVSTGASSVGTPDPSHVAGQAPASPNSTSTPHSANSAAAEEVERLRREAEAIKAEQLRLEEEIRLAKLKKEELSKQVQGLGEEDHIEIFCENPIDVMSAITEDHRTLNLRNDVEVMSQITEARTEAQHFSRSQKKKEWMILFACLFVVIVGAGVIGGVVSKKNGMRGGDNSSGAEGEPSGSAVVGDSKPTTSPTTTEVSGPNIIDLSDDVLPTASPSYASASPTFNTVYASKVKLQSDNEAILNIYEVLVMHPSGMNVAINKNTSQSSTFDENFAMNAVDGNNETYSSTLREEAAWWQVDLGGMTPIAEVSIMNRWCFDESDQADCLGRLSNSTLLLLDEDNAVVATRAIGDTTGVLDLEFSFDATAPLYIEVETSSPPVTVTTPTNPTPLSPIQTPTYSPIETQTQSTASSSCSSDEGLLSVFFLLGADPSQISWGVLEECTGTPVISCNKCYQNAEPYSSSDSHNCLPLQQGYKFFFEDPAGGLWSESSGYTVTFEGVSIISQIGNGGSMSDTEINFGGDGQPCPPTSKPTTGPTTHDLLPFPYPYPYTRFTPWADLDDTTESTALSLGYTDTLWDTPNLYDLEYNYVYSALDSTQQLAINNLGMDEDQWDCFMNHYENQHWDLMPDHAQNALIDLGWSKCIFDGEAGCTGSTPASESMNWRQLNSTEKAAAINLCWFRSSWDSYSLPW